MWQSGLGRGGAISEGDRVSLIELGLLGGEQSSQYPAVDRVVQVSVMLHFHPPHPVSH